MPEHYPIRQTGAGLHIDGFPDATKLILLKGKKAERVAHLFLHNRDLTFAADCLEKLNATADPTVRDALWRSAILFYIKCFAGGSRRSSLDEKRIYQGQPPEALQAFRYFKNLRNKHFIHDENPYGQSIPCAGLNGGNKTYKIEKVFTLAIYIETMEQNNYSNLHLLITQAQDWVARESDRLFNLLAGELEVLPYSKLLSFEDVKYIVPGPETVSQRRAGP